MAMQILCIAGPTASGKSARAVEEALARNGEIISVDSRQVYRGLDIGTEKISKEDMREVPHHIIDIREIHETYSAGDFVTDATRLIEDISLRGKLPILVGGTHFYFDALLHGLPMGIHTNPMLREKLEKLPTKELITRVAQRDPRRAAELDPQNRRRLIRALEIIDSLGIVPLRTQLGKSDFPKIMWITIDPPREELRARIDTRLKNAFERGLIDEVRRVRDATSYARLNELGLEYKIVGEFLRKVSNTECLTCLKPEESLIPVISAKLWQYARRQKAWLKKLSREII